MTNDKSKNETLENLKTTRDEIRLQAHLFKMETKDEWKSLEQKWSQLNQDLEPAKEAAEDAASDIGAAHGLLLDELTKGYRKIKEALKN